MSEEIEKIDKNFEVASTLGLEKLVYHDIRKAPFDIYGLYEPEKVPFRRLDSEVADAVSKGVGSLNYNTAGGRVRFKTDSHYIALLCKMPSVSNMMHMPKTGSSGFDLYSVNNGYHKYIKTFIPSKDATNGYETVVYVSGELTDFEINFPLYNKVDEVYIGLEEGSVLLHGGRYSLETPILYYGSSITQGGCASRPGNSYESMISRRFDCDYINLGFSGNAKGESNMADYLAGIKSSVFVCDYDHNSPTAEHLRETHYPVYEKYRKSNPDTPIILVSAPAVELSEKLENKRSVIYDTYQRAKKNGDENVYFIDGHEMMNDEFRECYTVDGSHPNDLGFAKMAKTIGDLLDKIL